MTEKPKPKHLVLDYEAEQLFVKSSGIIGAATQKETIKAIFERFLELNDLTNYHNSLDVVEIEELKKLKCDKINCKINSDLTQVNSDLNEVNTELTQVNYNLTQVNTDLNELNLELKNQLNELKNLLNIPVDVSDCILQKVSPLTKIALEIVASDLSKENKKKVTVLDVLLNMFTDYIFKHKLCFFDKPKSSLIQARFKQLNTKQDNE